METDNKEKLSLKEFDNKDCDCEDYENGFVSNYCPIHNENPYLNLDE